MFGQCVLLKPHFCDCSEEHRRQRIPQTRYVPFWVVSDPTFQDYLNHEREWGPELVQL